MLASVDVVIGLDYPRLTSLRRLIGRTVARAWTGEPVCNGNTETWRSSFASRDSILVWHARTWSEKRRDMRAWAADPSLSPVVLLTRPREAERLLATPQGQAR